MKLIITDSASQWFRQQLALTSGQGVKLFGTTIRPRHVEHTPNQGFATENSLSDAVLTTTKDGINYHINFADEWFFSGLVTTVDYQPNAGQPHFTFTKEQLNAASKSASEPTAPAIDATTSASQKFEDYWE